MTLDESALDQASGAAPFTKIEFAKGGAQATSNFTKIEIEG